MMFSRFIELGWPMTTRFVLIALVAIAVLAGSAPASADGGSRAKRSTPKLLAVSSKVSASTEMTTTAPSNWFHSSRKYCTTPMPSHLSSISPRNTQVNTLLTVSNLDV